MSDEHSLAAEAQQGDPASTWAVLPPWIVTGLGRCRGCHAEVAWAQHEHTGGRAPFDRDGTSHFATCPQADQFRRKR
jgi:hypothetical protein